MATNQKKVIKKMARRSQPLWTSLARDPGLIIVHRRALDHEDNVKSNH